MNYKIFSNLFRTILGFLVIGIFAQIYLFNNISQVYTQGDVVITFQGQPLHNPIFLLNDCKPGDVETRDIQTTNNDTVSHLISVKGIRTGPGGQVDPKLEDILEIIIKKDGQDIYGGSKGKKTVAQFFQDSTNPDGISLSSDNPRQTIIYSFQVNFPVTAGNEFQRKAVVFDLIFAVSGSGIKINEVYFQVDKDHGFDNSRDRKTDKECNLSQTNKTNAFINIFQNGSSANNSFLENSGIVKLFTGTIGNFFNSIFSGGLNNILCDCSCKLKQNDEWIELYNPTNGEVSLKGWKLVDNSGNETVITANKSIPAGGYALISKSSSTWKYWQLPKTLKIELGKIIGNGLDNQGDHLYLLNPQNLPVDAVGWGDDTVVWQPAVKSEKYGASIERNSPGFDLDLVIDWHEQLPPTPRK